MRIQNKPQQMTLQIVLILIVIGLAAGMLSGLVGVGGGIIVVPALVFFLGFTQHQAQGTSLGLLLLPVGILAVLHLLILKHLVLLEIIPELINKMWWHFFD